MQVYAWMWNWQTKCSLISTLHTVLSGSKQTIPQQNLRKHKGQKHNDSYFCTIDPIVQQSNNKPLCVISPSGCITLNLEWIPWEVCFTHVQGQG